jgi:hypothetical protein
MRNEATAFYSGQTNHTLKATIDGRVAGYVDWVQYGDEASVSMIEVAPEFRRQGVGLELLRQMMREAEPGSYFVPGMQTGDGGKLVEQFIARYKPKLPQQDEPDDDAQADDDDAPDIRSAGGPGSGNFGHAGRPGEVGGSAPSAGGGLADPLDVPVLKGVDSKANAASIRLVNYVNSGVTPEQAAEVRTELAALPLVHGTSVEAAEEAMHGGLVSASELALKAGELKAEVSDLKATIAEDLDVSREWIDEMREIVGHDPDEMLWQIEDSYDVDRTTAERVVANLRELNGLQAAIDGHTFPADRKLGLDRYVFMTHGALHSDYGPIAVVIDNGVLDRSWASQHDIATVAHGTSPNENEAEWDAKGVEKYQRGIVVGRDDYLDAASSDFTNSGALAVRSREQLWEVKAPRVSKGDVLGFFTSDLDEGIRLSENLHRSGKVLVTGAMYGADHHQWLSEQLKYLQKHGAWDDDAIRAYADEHDGAGVMLL